MLISASCDFKKRFPEMFEDYVRRCDLGQVKLGRPYLFRRLFPPNVLNFPTKEHWRSPSSLDAIVAGLRYLEAQYEDWGVTSLAVPPLGCGYGQLEWSVVGPTLYRHLSRLSIPVELYAPYGTPHDELQPTFLDATGSHSLATASSARIIKAADVAIVDVLNRIEQERHRWPVGRVTFQKLAYFVTESGVPTELKFQRGSYGPFAPDLKRLTARLINNGLIREERHGSMFEVLVGPTFKDARHAFHQELEHWRPALDRVVDLFLRLRTNRAEIAATVHYAAESLDSAGLDPTEFDVFKEVLTWKKRRKPPVDESAVASTIRGLGVLGWLKVKSSPRLPVPRAASR